MTNFDFTFAPDSFVSIGKKDTRQMTRKRRLDGRSARDERFNGGRSMGSRHIIGPGESKRYMAGIIIKRNIGDCDVDVEDLDRRRCKHVDGSGGPM